MSDSIKSIYLGVIALLVTSCTSIQDTRSLSADQLRYIDPAHLQKDVYVTFPAWVSETEKINALNSAAQIKASQKCFSTSYTLVDLYSNPYTLSPIRGSGISANIICNTTQNISTASTSTDKNSPDLNFQSNYPLCQGSDIRNWTNCFGTHNWASGFSNLTYVGEWKDGRRHGYGTLTAQNGDKYVGSWLNNQRDGSGIQTYGDGRKPQQGVWSEGQFVRTGQSTQVIAPTAPPQKIPPPLVQPTQLAIQSTNSNEKRIALVIGNSSYVVRPLLNPRNDADDMSRALKNAGFEVIDVRDASLPQMRNAVRQFGDRLLTRDVGLVYYSGHGMEVRGRNYFIPVNADIKRSDEIVDQSLDVNLILEKMETAKKGVNILIVDACRDDPFGRSFRSSSKGLATMDAPQGTIIAFATSPGKVAADGDGRNSPYTKNLIKAMQVPNLPIEQVFKQVRRAVQQETKNQQTPWENTSLSGDFYFSVKK